MIDKPLAQWINEGLMVFFFPLVGLEIKRQVLEGQLSTLPQITLPALAAAGGMVVPAAIYWAVAGGDPMLARGWAIPTATDIVLALGVLSLLGRRVPDSLKIFLTALAVFDDIGAVLIVGLFYSEGTSPIALALAGAAVAALLLLNAFHVTRTTPFAIVGVFLWLALLKSGVHATLAGVAIGFAIPMRVAGPSSYSPLREMEHRLHAWVILGIVPLFAFFNSGIALSGVTIESIATPLSLGVMLGLFLGKQAGVFAAVWMAVRLRVAVLPSAANWSQLYGVALLAGIGFTMSLFVTTLAFSDARIAASAKAAILLGSLASAATGLLILHRSTERSTATTEPVGSRI